MVIKYQATKSYDSVNVAEYSLFKKRTHTLEDIAVKLSEYGFVEVDKGRKHIDAIQKKTNNAIRIVSVIAIILWGLVIPIVFARRVTSVILNLSKVSDEISKVTISLPAFFLFAMSLTVSGSKCIQRIVSNSMFFSYYFPQAKIYWH